MPITTMMISKIKIKFRMQDVVCGQISGDRRQEMTKDASFSNVAPRICQDFRKQRIDDETIYYDNWKVCEVVKNVRLSLLR